MNESAEERVNRIKKSLDQAEKENRQHYLKKEDLRWLLDNVKVNIIKEGE